jgi:hypothetical protein
VALDFSPIAEAAGCIISALIAEALNDPRVDAEDRAALALAEGDTVIGHFETAWLRLVSMGLEHGFCPMA